MYIYLIHTRKPKNAKQDKTNKQNETKETPKNKKKHKNANQQEINKHRKEDKFLKKRITLPVQHFISPITLWSGGSQGYRYCSEVPPAIPIHLIFQLCPWPLNSSGEHPWAQPMTEPCFFESTGLTKPGKLRGSSRHFTVSCSAFPRCAISQRVKKIRALFCPSL